MSINHIVRTPRGNKVASVMQVDIDRGDSATATAPRVACRPPPPPAAPHTRVCGWRECRRPGPQCRRRPHREP